MKDIDDYLDQVDMIDLHITKNINKIIKNKKELDYIKSNLFLIGSNNKIRKNSLRLMLDDQEYKTVESLIKYNQLILEFKNTNQTNLFQMIITIDYFYDLVLKLLEDLDVIFLTKILTNKDNNFIDSIDLILSIITSNQYILLSDDNTNINNVNIQKQFNQILKILKSIYELDIEDKIFLITRLCYYIKNEKLLLSIIKFIEPSNFDIYPDSNLFTCVDYLFMNENIKVLEYLIPRINYIYFLNTDINLVFEFIKRIKEISIEKSIHINKLIELLFEILSKSNIKKIKNIRNESILFVMVKDLNLIKDDIVKYLEYFNLDEQNIDGESISSLLNLKSKNTKLNFSSIDINYKKILEKTDIGVFSSDIEHNMIYTLIMLRKYKNLSIPWFRQTKEYYKKNSELINLSNNDFYVMSFLKNYFYRFNTFLPFIIIWKNSNNNYLDPNLILYLKNNLDLEYVYVRLSINITNELGENIRHANILFIDNKNKVVERFEPYGDISFYNSRELNSMLESNLVNVLDYKYKFVQPYPGFQLRSDEFEKKNKVYGDPAGFCLAWCLLYLETKLMLLEQKIKINPVKYINWYIINQFHKDFPEIKSTTETNKYMTFIRYYSKKLDSRKVKLLEDINIEPNILYRNEIPKKEVKNLNLILNEKLYDILNIK